VELVRIIGDASKWAARHRLVFTGKVMLVDQHPVMDDENRMRIGLVPRLEARADGAQDRRVEPLCLRSGDVPPVMQIGRFAAFVRVNRAGAQRQHRGEHDPQPAHHYILRDTWTLFTR
jgi:hypothetical protein